MCSVHFSQNRHSKNATPLSTYGNWLKFVHFTLNILRFISIQEKSSNNARITDLLSDLGPELLSPQPRGDKCEVGMNVDGLACIKLFEIARKHALSKLHFSARVERSRNVSLEARSPWTLSGGNS